MNGLDLAAIVCVCITVASIVHSVADAWARRGGEPPKEAGK